ncbi:lipopolysaccharide assembly LapA domain-containing protein [Thalassobacillus sp. CUG 92003]|uniref:LapA family protein n=1 Tax=Thalassobacillus sp. CUG 92003 TaxID=2736641 RepID=UPI0015E69320|nr:lipopolysaccharide assembly protein LapA domain-containing protein [Thalassobacillus sp. CUG 92003]
MRGQSYIILALIFALLIAIFAVINVEPVEVNYLFGTGEAPLILVIIISVLMGGLITASVGAVKYFKLQRENKGLRQHATTSSERSKESSLSNEEPTYEESPSKIDRETKQDDRSS